MGQDRWTDIPALVLLARCDDGVAYKVVAGLVEGGSMAGGELAPKLVLC